MVNDKLRDKTLPLEGRNRLWGDTTAVSRLSGIYVLFMMKAHTDMRQTGAGRRAHARCEREQGSAAVYRVSVFYTTVREF